MTWLLVALGGAAGASARYGIGLAVGPRPFPFATLAINIIGSFLLGHLLTVAATGRLGPQATAALGVGVLGAFTTYSTFSWELVVLGRSDRWLAASAYLGLSVALGVAAAMLGYRAGLRLQA